MATDDPRVGVTNAVLQDLRARGLVRAVSRTQAQIRGLDVELIGDDDAEGALMVVCGYPPSAYPSEDILTWCHDCHCAIVHRPHAPRRPIKVCDRCARVRLQQLAREGPL